LTKKQNHKQNIPAHNGTSQSPVQILVLYAHILNFSWTRIWQCVSVCPKTLGQSTEPKNGWIWLKFGTLFLGNFGPRGPGPGARA